MKTAIKRENSEFLGITLKHVSGLKVALNSPRTIKLWAIAHENGRKTRKRRVYGHIFPTRIGRKVTVNRPRTPKLWAIAHENGHKTRERGVSGHISQKCNGSYMPCKSNWNQKLWAITHKNGHKHDKHVSGLKVIVN